MAARVKQKNIRDFSAKDVAGASFLQNGDNSTRYALIASMVFNLSLFSGCAHFPMESGYPGPKPLPEEIREEYKHERFTGVFDEKISYENKFYRLKEIQFAPGGNIFDIEHKIRLDYYEIIGAGPSPAILVLPILGGKNTVARIFADYFARNGFASVIVHRQKKYKQINDITKLDKTLRQMVQDHKHAVDWMESRPELDPEKIGVFGVSMGGIKSALLSALEGRIRAGIIALGAGDLPYVLTYSKEKRLARRRDDLLKKDNLSLEEFHEKLRGEIVCDPANYAEYIDARTTLMILARFDDAVPFEKGNELRRLIGKPETIYLLSGHYSSAFFINYIKQASLNFFEKKLLSPFSSTKTHKTIRTMEDENG